MEVIIMVVFKTVGSSIVGLSISCGNICCIIHSGLVNSNGIILIAMDGGREQVPSWEWERVQNWDREQERNWDRERVRNWDREQVRNWDREQVWNGDRDRVWNWDQDPPQRREQPHSRERDSASSGVTQEGRQEGTGRTRQG
jgi:hypothetical protein